MSTRTARRRDAEPDLAMIDFSAEEALMGDPGAAVDGVVVDPLFGDLASVPLSPAEEPLAIGRRPAGAGRYTLPASPEEALVMISGASGAARDRLVDSFFIVHDDLINFVARRQCRAYGLSYADRFDDVRAIARETAWLILNNLDTEGAEAIRSFPAFLMTRTRTAVRVASESAAWTGVSGSVGRMRRYRALETRLGPVRRELGRDLTKQETRAAIAAYNDELRATRTDAEKQGALVSEADLAPPTLVDLCENNAATFTVDEAEIAPFEMVNVAKAVVANAYRGRHDLGVIAQAYYGPYLADRQSEPPRIPEIVAHTGFNRMKVSRAILRIHELSRAELVELGFPRHAPFQTQD